MSGGTVVSIHPWLNRSDKMRAVPPVRPTEA